MVLIETSLRNEVLRVLPHLNDAFCGGGDSIVGWDSTDLKYFNDFNSCLSLVVWNVQLLNEMSLLDIVSSLIPEVGLIWVDNEQLG